MFQPTRRGILLGAANLGATAFLRPAIAQTPPDFRLGALYPESGPLALIGQESFRGLELAVEARNAAGGVQGRRIVLYRRNAQNPGQASQAARQLMSAERVAAVFGTAASPLAVPASVAAELQGVPYFELGAPSDALTLRGDRFVFRSAATASAEAALTVRACMRLLPELWSTPLAQLRVFLLHEGGAYGQNVALVQEALLRQGLGPVAAGRFAYPAAALPEQNPNPAADYPAIVQRMRDTKPDVVLHSGYPAEAQALFAAMRGANWAPRMLIGTATGYGMRDTADAIGADVEGVMVVGPAPYAVGGPLAAAAATWAERYAARHGQPPRSGYSLQDALGASVFLEALHRAGSTDRERIRDAVLAMRGTDAGFPFEVDGSGQNRLAQPVLSQWQAGPEGPRLVAIAPEPAALAPPAPRMVLISSP